MCGGRSSERDHLAQYDAKRAAMEASARRMREDAFADPDRELDRSGITATLTAAGCSAEEVEKHLHWLAHYRLMVLEVRAEADRELNAESSRGRERPEAKPPLNGAFLKRLKSQRSRTRDRHALAHVVTTSKGPRSTSTAAVVARRPAPRARARRTAARRAGGVRSGQDPGDGEPPGEPSRSHRRADDRGLDRPLAALEVVAL